jgi:ribosomal protein L37AE/L43A
MIGTMRIQLLLCVVLLLCAASAGAQTMLCQSNDIEYRECRVGSSGTIRLIMEISDRRCHEGITWGTVSQGVVWVKRGCRAHFGLNTPSNLRNLREANRVVCESQKGNRQVCPADIVGRVALAQQLSRTECVQGKNWDYDTERGLIWVDYGCRAAFIVGATTEKIPPVPSLDAHVTCESEHGKRQDCKADTAEGVQIVRALSESPCGYGREWGYDENGIWVTRNCRAEFAVRGRQKAMARAITCESTNDARIHCAAETQFGVAIVKQLSESDCVLGDSWGFDETGVWVSHDCQAQFALGGYRLPVDKVPDTAARMRCESQDGGRKQCPVDTSRGVGLIEQLSGADCVLNRTWGYDRTGIWVTNGCRAEFAVAR